MNEEEFKRTEIKYYFEKHIKGKKLTFGLNGNGKQNVFFLELGNGLRVRFETEKSDKEFFFVARELEEEKHGK